MLSRLFITAVWSSAWKRLTFNCVFVTFPCGILGQMWYLIVSFPDLCRHSYLDIFTGQICVLVAAFVKNTKSVELTWWLLSLCKTGISIP